MARFQDEAAQEGAGDREKGRGQRGRGCWEGERELGEGTERRGGGGEGRGAWAGLRGARRSPARRGASLGSGQIEREDRPSRCPQTVTPSCLGRGACGRAQPNRHRRVSKRL